MSAIFRSSFLSSIVFAGLAAGQPAVTPPSAEAGIPVTDPLVIAKCGTCHTRDERGNMQHLSYARTTPEGWQEALKRMILGNGVSLTPDEARSVVKYLSTNHGLAPEEAKPVLYDVERRIHEETSLPRGGLGNACTKCHSFARALSWRRSPEEWKLFADKHAARYKTPSDATVAVLSKSAPLHTPEWDAWSARTNAARTPNLAGRWLVTASIPGHGKYYGEMQVDPAGEDEYTTRVTLTSVQDGSTIARSGRSAVYGSYAWRGRSKGNGPAGATPDDLSSEAREVLWIAPDQATAEGRWYWGQYQEFGFDVKLQRPSAALTVVAVDRTSLKAGSQANRIRLIGYNFPARVTAADLDLGAGVTVRSVTSPLPNELTAEVDVAADAPLGKREISFQRAPLPFAIAIYDRVDYVKVTPESALATFGNTTLARGFQQFEAIGYQRGADGKPRTADDVELGPVDVTWSLEVFYVAPGADTDFVGKVSPSGLLAPAAVSPGNNFDVWVVATSKSERDSDGLPLAGKGYVVVTVPAYSLNGRRYVRDLNRWVDNGPEGEK